MMPRFSPAWVQTFAQPVASSSTVGGQRPVPPASVPAHPLVGGYPISRRAARDGGATSAAPPPPPVPPVDYRPLPPEPARRPLEYAWLTWQMPPVMRADVVFNLRQTFDWRAQYCQPLKQPKTPHAYTRFGLLGEALVPPGGVTVRKHLRAELRETVRTLEGEQPRLERNWMLAMHSVRLGQLCAELEQRGLDALEEVRCGLAVLWE